MLRGEEGFMLDAFGFRKHIAKGKYDRKHPHVVSPMLGRFRGEDGERMHLLLIADRSESGLEYRKWLERLIEVLDMKGQDHGPAFCEEDGHLEDASLYEDVILSESKEI
jgi:hypothetical protein